ncbi:glycosyltransferase [Ancylothrix sp. C2]|uniref:glycosyltransferase n=1 Tax=Ancylothrix sp. D3o TaxID=2953691 RepID=UPI0021BA9BBE|nr:glycosyltransferase [Ancylothrix sp. D3o]MCT7951046.1 glycosyltransferase [Ancylothrix sp. D3o]
MTFLPKTSVIIPIHNGEKDIPELLECLENQTYPKNLIEYLLIDNNSTDNTPNLLKAAKLPPLSQKEIQSSYAARNTGIHAATGEIIAFTDADCRPKPNWLLTLIQPFVKPQIGIVAGEIIALPGKSLLEKYAQKKEILSQKHTLAHPHCPYGQTANLAIRRQIFQEMGLFRPYLTTGGDADICWRILKQTNWQLEFVPEAIVQHRHRSTWKELHSQWKKYGQSNQYLHQLHGIDLTRELTKKEFIYRISRWLIKELPLTTIKTIFGQTPPLDLLTTPIDLYCFQARTEGQKQATLSETAKQIENLEKSP